MPYAALGLIAYGRCINLVSPLGRSRENGVARLPASSIPNDGSVEGSRGYPHDPCGRARAGSVGSSDSNRVYRGRASAPDGRTGRARPAHLAGPPLIFAISPLCAAVSFFFGVFRVLGQCWVARYGVPCRRNWRQTPHGGGRNASPLCALRLTPVFRDIGGLLQIMSPDLGGRRRRYVGAEAYDFCLVIADVI